MSNCADDVVGGMAGSLILNDRFEQAVADLIGKDILIHLQQDRPWAWHEALKTFDRHVKTAYRGDDREKHPVTFLRGKLKNDLENNLEDSSWIMTGYVRQCRALPFIFC